MKYKYNLSQKQTFSYETNFKPCDRIYSRNNEITNSGSFINSKASNHIKNICAFVFHNPCRYYPFKFITFTCGKPKANFSVKNHRREITSLGRLFDYLKTISVEYNKNDKLQYKKNKVIGFKNYLWVAEIQKRGVIHFHVLTDAYYMDLKYITDYWIKLTSNIYTYESKNCIDLKYIKSSKSLSNYLTKYITKNKSKIYGRPWAASREFSRFGKLGVCTSETPLHSDNDVYLSTINYIERTDKETGEIILKTINPSNYITESKILNIFDTILKSGGVT